MPTYSITLTFHGDNIRTVAALAKKTFGEYAETQVMKVLNPTSRAERLATAGSKVKDDAYSEVESLKDELQEWLDNLPENLQGSQKADDLQEAIDRLEEILSGLDDIDWDVEFPGMMG